MMYTATNIWSDWIEWIVGYTNCEEKFQEDNTRWYFCDYVQPIVFVSPISDRPIDCSRPWSDSPIVSQNSPVRYFDSPIDRKYCSPKAVVRKCDSLICPRITRDTSKSKDTSNSKNGSNSRNDTTTATAETPTAAEMQKQFWRHHLTIFCDIWAKNTSNWWKISFK